MSKATWMAALAASALACGCARTPITPELVAARDSYAAARRGPARTLAPDKLNDAYRAMAVAEAIHLRDPASLDERDTAYVAERDVEAANAQAELVEAQRALVDEQHRLALLQARAGEAELRAALLKVENAADRLENAQERVARERAAAERAAAHNEIVRVATVTSEPSGMLVRMSSDVLFPLGKATLRPDAYHLLDDIAATLRAEQRGSRILVEGYTDSTGEQVDKVTLATERAVAVRRYLVDHGVDPARIQAFGRGPADPVATNATAEGRQLNRRIEIVLQRPAPSASR